MPSDRQAQKPSNFGKIAMTRIALTQGSEIQIGAQSIIFERELSGGFLSCSLIPTGAPWLVEVEGGGSRLPKWVDVEAHMSRGEFKIIRDANRLPNRGTSQLELDPDDIWLMDPKAKVRAFYVRSWDAAQTGLGRSALEALIEEKFKSEAAKDFAWKPSSSSLRRWILARGEIADRRTIDMISQTGRTSKAFAFAPSVNRAIMKCVVWYWSLDGRSIEDAYARLRRIVRILNCLAKSRAKKLLKAPHCDTLRRYIRREESYDTWCTRYGRRAADARWRPTGRSLEATTILQIAILDHTVLDNWCVLNMNSRLPMGRPYLVIIIDVFSRCILGWLVTYEPPQIWTVGEAIKRANRPKPWLRDRFPKAQSGADIYGKMCELIIDNALENTGQSAKDALLDLGISITFAPIATPTYKSIVERFFGILNSMLVHKLAGAVRVSIETRRLLGIDPAKDAVLTVDEVEALIEEAVNYYHHNVHESLNAAPALVWKKAAQAGVNVLHDDSLLSKTLGVVQHGTLDRRGIRYNHLWYLDAAVTETILMNNVAHTPVKGRRKKSASIRVKFKFDPIDLGHIHVFDPATRKYYRMPAKNVRYATGLSRYQHEFVRKLAEQENEAFSSEDEQFAALQRLRTRIESAAPELRTKARKAAMRLLDNPASRSRVEGDLVVVSVEGRDAGGQLVIPNSNMAHRRTDGGAAVGSARVKKRAKIRHRQAPIEPTPTAPTIGSFRPNTQNQSDDEFLANQGW
jgi:putative transposase